MRILMLSDVYFPRVNGVSSSIGAFRRALLDQGHDVSLVAPHYHEGSTDDEAAVLRVPARPVPFDPEDRLMHWGNLQRGLQQFNARNTDIIHIHTPFIAHYAGVKLARRLGIPCVETYHTYFEAYFHHYLPLAPAWLTGGIARRLSRSQGNAVQGLVVPSRPIRDSLIEYGVTAPLEIIPTGLHLKDWQGGDAQRFRAAHQIPPDAPLIGTISRIAHEKNIGFLLNMFQLLLQQLPDALFVLAGEGPAQASLQAQAERLGLASQIRFVGYLDRHSTLLDCYQACDVFVFASRTETQGLVLLEAMAQQVPVVSTAVLGTKDVLVDGEGCVVVPEQEAAFSAAVQALLLDPARRRALGERGQSYTKAWSIEHQAARLTDFYQTMLNDAPQTNTAVAGALP